MNKPMLAKPDLIDSGAYWISCFDGSEGVAGNSFEKYHIVFVCHTCAARIESLPLVPNGKRVSAASLEMRSIDPADFAARCERLRGREQMGPPYFLVQDCATCEKQYLILFGATEWQPTRYIIVLGGIYEYA